MKKNTSLKNISINPCEILYLYDKDNNNIGNCLDTPNAFAYACLLNDKVVKGIAKYPYWEDNIRLANDQDIIDRINTFKKSPVDFPKSKFQINFIDNYLIP